MSIVLRMEPGLFLITYKFNRKLKKLKKKNIFLIFVLKICQQLFLGSTSYTRYMIVHSVQWCSEYILE